MTEQTDGTPLVTVVTPAYRVESRLPDTIESVLAQTMPSLEHLIVDDASPDGTWNVIQRYASQDSRVVAIRLEENAGPAHARNAAIRASRGRYVAFLDADDLWLPHKLERQLAFMRHHDAPLSFSWYERVDDEGQRSGRVVSAPSEVGYRDLLKSNHIGCLTAMYDSNVLGKPEMPSIRVHQDWGYWLALTRTGIVARCVPEVLALYRYSYGQTVSSNKLRTVGYKWRVFRELEGFGVFRSLYYLAHVAIRGYVKMRK